MVLRLGVSDPTNPTPRKMGSLFPALAFIALAFVVVLLSQHALAAGLGRFVAQLWVSVMDAVLRLLGAMFGG